MASIKHFPFVWMSTDIGENMDEIESNISLSIITLFTEREKAKLVDQLERNGIGYINAAEGLEDFNKAFKPVYYENALKGVTDEFALIIDSYDTIIYNIDEMPSCLSHYGKDALYGAWNIHFPTFIDFDFHVPEDNKLKYLNSGVFFGKTDSVKQYYSELSAFIKEEYDKCDNWLKEFEHYWIYRFLSEGRADVNIGIDFDELLVKNNPPLFAN